MKRSLVKDLVIVGVLSVLSGVAGAEVVPAKADQQGVTYRSPSGTTLRLILDHTNVGPQVSMGELNFAPNTDSGEHAHGSTEIFYVLEGELEHVVNGKSQFLRPGMAGYVNPPDKVIHKTGPAGARAIVVWVPGDEAGKIVTRWTKEP
jgi:quercetin dioxygenase-like cupin family protein